MARVQFSPDAQSTPQPGNSVAAAARSQRDRAVLRCVAILGLAVFTACIAAVVLPLNELMARAEGHVLIVDEPGRQVVATAGGRAALNFRVTNVASRSVTIDGVESLCGCTSIEPLPVTIPALESVVLTVSFNLDGRPTGSTYTWNPRIFVNCSSPEIRLNVELQLQ